MKHCRDLAQFQSLCSLFDGEQGIQIRVDYSRMAKRGRGLSLVKKGGKKKLSGEKGKKGWGGGGETKKKIR